MFCIFLWSWQELKRNREEADSSPRGKSSLEPVLGTGACLRVWKTNMVQTTNLKIPNQSTGSRQKFHQLHETPELTHVGETRGPNPMHEDLQELHKEEDQMELSALLLAPFITWHVAEDASQIAPAWQIPTGSSHRSSTHPSHTIWLSHAGSQEALSNSCSANASLLIAGFWKGTSDAPLEGEPFRDGFGLGPLPLRKAQISSTTSSDGLGSIV